MELFAAEVGARRYCSKFVLCCLKKLCFNDTVIRKNIKELSWNSLFVSGWQEITKNELLLTSAFTRLSHLYRECHAHCIVVTNGGVMG